LVGPVEKSVIKCTQPNVFFVGEKPLTEIPSYISSFDVCLNLFKDNALAKGVNPLKFYEYLAQGKPVVGLILPSIAQFASVFYSAGSVDEYERGIQKALEETDSGLIASRMAIAQEHSWESIFSRLYEKLC
jgi:glycosyltransferase involved in cell wall biosynthesis